MKSNHKIVVKRSVKPGLTLYCVPLPIDFRSHAKKSCMCRKINEELQDLGHVTDVSLQYNSRLHFYHFEFMLNSSMPFDVITFKEWFDEMISVGRQYTSEVF